MRKHRSLAQVRRSPRKVVLVNGIVVEPIYGVFGALVREIRERIGINQAELARRLKLTRTSITNLEAGRQRDCADQGDDDG